MAFGQPSERLLPQSEVCDEGCVPWGQGAGRLLRFAFRYSPREQLKGDLTAGVTVGVMIIPQSMAYAVIAGLPPVTGLYASCAPLLLYACLGSSKHLGCGPQALVCLLVRSALQTLGDEGVGDGPVQRAALLSVLVGMMSCLMGCVRMGILEIFLSRSLMSAFVSASAVIIIIELLGDLLGISVPHLKYPWQTLVYVCCHLEQTNMASLTLGMISICLQLLCKSCKPKLSQMSGTGIVGCARRALLLVCDFSALLVFAAGSVCAYVSSARGVYISVVGELPSGLPPFTVPTMPEVGSLQELAPLVFSMALLIFVIAMSAGAPFALKHGYSINADQELLALGCSNIASGLFGGFPISGSMSRSAVNSQCDSSSALAIAVTAVLVACTLLFLSSVFAFLPHCSLAAIIGVSVLGLLHVQEFVDAYFVAPGDFLVMISTLLVCIGLGMKSGLFVGFIISIAALTHHAAQPNMVVLGELSNGTLMTASHFPDGHCRPLPGAVCVRLDAPLVFANAQGFKTFISREVEQRRACSDEVLQFVLVDMRGVNYVDVTGLQVLSEIRRELSKDDVQLVLCNLKNPVIAKFVRASKTPGLMSMPQEHLYLDIRVAVDVVKRLRTVSDAGQEYTEYTKRNMPEYH